MLYLGGTVFIFYGGVVYQPRGKELPTPLHNHTLWTLLDVNCFHPEPPSHLVENRKLTFPVQASSPRTTSHETWGNMRQPGTYGMTLWNREELIQAYVAFACVLSHC